LLLDWVECNGRAASTQLHYTTAVRTTLISTETLAARLADGRGAGWAVVDCRYDLKDEAWGRRQYLELHIPGAVYASLSDDMSAPPDGTNGRHPLPSPEGMRQTFGRLGIGPGTQVVLYDQDDGRYASRLWWMLRYMGHRAAAVLDGGWAKWTREGRPSRGGEETPAPAAFEGTPQPGARLRVDEVESLLGRPVTLLVDARAPERYEGRNETIDRAAGHIPGAANHFYQWNVGGDGTMLPPEQLRAQFELVLGGRDPEQVVMYCGSGVTACQNLLAMEHAGLTGARLYPGSWSEWSSDPTRPIETAPGSYKPERST
jgi:thiosulfate/3-mercaptopyruvate sulfurtransferase